MSGYTGTATALAEMPHQGAPLLNKPFRKADLAQVVRQTLDGTCQHPDQTMPAAAGA
jgi:hypothetical protein